MAITPLLITGIILALTVTAKLQAPTVAAKAAAGLPRPARRTPRAQHR